MQKNALIVRKEVLDDFISLFGSQLNFAQFFRPRITVYILQGWLHDNTAIALNYLIPLSSYYRNNGYVLRLLYKKRPSDQAIENNVCYLYRLSDTLEYAVIDSMGKIKRIPIAPLELGEQYREILSILSDVNEKKQCQDPQIILLKKLTEKRGYKIKKWTMLSSEMIKYLSGNLYILPEQIADFAKQYKCKPMISACVAGVRVDRAAGGNRHGRKKKNADSLCNGMIGKTILLYFEKWFFNSADSYYRAARVCDHGCPELIAAMDSGQISISTADSKAKASFEEQRLFLSTRIPP